MSEQKNPVKALENTRGSKGQVRKRSEELSDYVFGKVPPQALALEEAVLGAIMLDKDAMSVVLDILRADSFYTEAHQAIFKAMLRLFEHSQPIDLLTVMEQLKKAGDLETVGGPAYLAALTNKVASAANIEFHARIIAQKFIQRELIRVSTTIIRDAFEDTTDVFDLLDTAEQGLFSIAEKNMSRGYEAMSSLASKVYKQLLDLQN
jgi:replicative DNA helicase